MQSQLRIHKTLVLLPAGLTRQLSAPRFARTMTVKGGWNQRTCFNSAPVVSRNLAPRDPLPTTYYGAATVESRKLDHAVGMGSEGVECR